MMNIPQARSEFRGIRQEDLPDLIRNEPAVQAEHRRLLFEYTNYVVWKAKNRPSQFFRGLMRRRNICAIELSALREARRTMELATRE